MGENGGTNPERTLGSNDGTGALMPTDKGQHPTVVVNSKEHGGKVRMSKSEADALGLKGEVEGAPKNPQSKIKVRLLADVEGVGKKDDVVMVDKVDEKTMKAE